MDAGARDLWRLFGTERRNIVDESRGPSSKTTPRDSDTAHDPFSPQPPTPARQTGRKTAAARRSFPFGPATWLWSGARSNPSGPRRRRVGHRRGVARVRLRGPRGTACRCRCGRNRPRPAGGGVRLSGCSARRRPADSRWLGHAWRRDARLRRGGWDMGLVGPPRRQHSLPVGGRRCLRRLLPDRRRRSLHVPARIVIPARHPEAHDRLADRGRRRRHRRLAYALPPRARIAGSKPPERGSRTRLSGRRPGAPVRRRHDCPAPPAGHRCQGPHRTGRRSGAHVRGRCRLRTVESRGLIRPRALARRHIPQFDAPDRHLRILPVAPQRDRGGPREGDEPVAPWPAVRRARRRLLGRRRARREHGHGRTDRGAVRGCAADGVGADSPGAGAPREQPPADGTSTAGVGGTIQDVDREQLRCRRPHRS